MTRLAPASGTGNKFGSRPRIQPHPHAYLDGAECMLCCWRQPSLPSFLQQQLQPCRDKRGQLWGWRLILSAPRRSTILKLDALVRRQHGKVSRFDVALDWLVTDPDQWQNRFVRHLVLRWRRKGPMHDIGATTYWCRPGARRNLIIYADKPSKLDGRPCCHLELRIQTVKNARAEGVTHLSDLLTLDPQRLFAKHVKWSHSGVEEKLEQIRQQAAQHARRQLIKGGPFYPV